MTLTARQILDLAIAAGFRGNDAVTAVAIALAESSGQTDALNPQMFRRGEAIPANLQPIMGKVCNQDYCGDYSLGLWQINMRPDFAADRLKAWGLPNVAALYDPRVNAGAAYSLYRGRGGKFTDWSTFLYGDYKHFLGNAQAAWALYQAEQAQPEVIPTSPPPNPLPGPVQQSPAEPGPISSPEHSSTAPAPKVRPSLASLLGQLRSALLLWWASR